MNVPRMALSALLAAVVPLTLLVHPAQAVSTVVNADPVIQVYRSKTGLTANFNIGPGNYAHTTNPDLGYYLGVTPHLTSTQGNGWTGFNVPALHTGTLPTSLGTFGSVQFYFAVPNGVTQSDFNAAFRWIAQTSDGYYATAVPVTFSSNFNPDSAGTGYEGSQANDSVANFVPNITGKTLATLAGAYVGSSGLDNNLMWIGELSIGYSGGAIYYQSNYNGATQYSGLLFTGNAPDPTFNCESSSHTNN